MAARWVGLSRPHKTVRRAARATLARTVHDFRHALGAMSVLAMAAGMNFALQPDALAEVIRGERSIVGFVPTETALAAIFAPQAEEAQPEIVLDETEVRLLAATAWGEARSEGEEGMRAVSHVMVNRVGERFGEDLSTVILAPRQFSVWNRNDPNRRLVMSLVRDPAPYTSGENAAAWETAQRVAREVLSGKSVDPTGGALFYHTRAVRPSWARVGQGRQVIGAHIFYADVPDAARRRTPRLIDVAQALRLPIGGADPVSASPQRGPRAGRVNGVIQYAPANSARQALPSEAEANVDVNAAATPTIDGQTVTPAVDAVSATAAAP